MFTNMQLPFFKNGIAAEIRPATSMTEILLGMTVIRNTHSVDFKVDLILVDLIG